MSQKAKAWRIDLVDSLYGELAESDSMQSAMEVAGKHLHAGQGAVQLHCKRSGEVRLLGSYRFPDGFYANYAPFAILDPWPLVYQRSGASPTDCILSHEWLSDDELRAMEFYQELWRHYGYMHTGGAYLPVNKKWHLMVSFARLADDGPYGPKHRGDIRFISRHLRYASMLVERIRRTEERAALRQLALDRLDFAVMLINSEGELLDANEAARALVGKGRLFRLNNRRLQGATEKNRAALSQGLSSLSGAEPVPPLGMRFRESTGGHAWSGYLWPVQWEDRTLYFLILLDSARREIGGIKALGTLLGLSQAETTILAALVEGRSLEEIAESRHVSRETVRSQLKSLLGKTGCRRQGELVALAARMTPPVTG